MRKYNTIFLIAVIMVITGCMGDKTESIKIQPEQKADKSKSAIILSTTTSTRDSGLLDYLLPEFTKETGVEVKVVAVGKCSHTNASKAARILAEESYGYPRILFCSTND